MVFKCHKQQQHIFISEHKLNIRTYHFPIVCYSLTFFSLYIQCKCILYFCPISSDNKIKGPPCSTGFLTLNHMPLAHNLEFEHRW